MPAPRFESPVHDVRLFKPRRSDYCACVVTWNEGDRLRSQLERMKPFADDVDIVIADGDSVDGSTDPGFLERMGVRALLSTKEIGLGTATRMGLAFALREGYAGVITLDGNGKDGVGALPRFVSALKGGADLVQGSRFMEGGVEKNTPLGRRLGIRFLLAPLIRFFAGGRYTDPTNAFRALSRRFLDDPRVQPIRREFVRFNLQHYLICRAALLRFRVEEIPVTRVYPAGGAIPTKIRGLRAHLAVVTELVSVLLGRLNP